MSRSDRRIDACVLLVLFGSYAYFFQGGGWNPNARLDLTRALSERGTIAIDAYWRNTGDWALHGGHRYANKAPGLSFASAPIFAATGPVARALLPDDPAARLRARAVVTNAAVNALPSALLGVVLLRVLFALGLGSRVRCAWAALAFGLGTLVFPYAGAYYAHTLAGALSFAAFSVLLRARRASGLIALPALAGALAGAAVLVETSAALSAAILCVALAADARGRRLLPAFAAGGAPLAIALLAYNQAAFGGVFATSLAHANPEVVVRIDGQLFGVPGPGRLYGLLVSPYRGLLFTSPVLALAPFGFSALRRSDAFAARVSVLVPAAFLLLIASFHAWHGGWAPGPRYLIPSLAFLFLPVAFGLVRWPRLGATLAAVSAGVMLCIALVAIEVPQVVKRPISGFVLPHLAQGRVSANPQDLDEFLPDDGYLRGSEEENWSSFNLGEWLFPHRVESVLPLLLVWVAAGLWLGLPGPSAPRPGESP